ncbi:MAG: class I SAM-dependent methyltransferase [Thermomicrobiales bacterium]
MAQQLEQTVATNPAEMYESYFVPAIFLPWAEELLHRAAPKPGERVLDVACGTGAVARQIAPLVGASGSVVGLDLSPGMLAVAGSRPAPAGASITWQQGSADDLPFPNEAFDLVLCQQGLQFFPDRPAAVREMRRVLAPGGRAALSVWRGQKHQSLYDAFDAAVERHLGVAEEGGPFSFGDAADLRTLLDEAGFRDVSIKSVTRTVRFPRPEQFVRLTILAYAAVAPDYEQMDEAARNALIEAVRRDIDGTIRMYQDGDALAFPMTSHLVVARAERLC